MKRPMGVTLSAIILLMGSLLQLVMAFGMALSGAVTPHPYPGGAAANPSPHAAAPSWMPLMMYFIGIVFVGLAIWGIVTAIGLFRLRWWARYSVLVIAGCLAFFGLVSMLVMIVVTMVPLTPPPGTSAAALDPAHAHTVQMMTRVIFVVFTSLYGVVCAIGISWLVYFNRKTAREAFAGRIADAPVGYASAAPLIRVPSGRPVLISVIAVLNMIGAASMLMTVFLPIPALAFGFILHGWAKIAVYLVYCCLQIAVGIGLWRMREWGRRLTLGVLALGVAQSTFYAFRPSLIVSYSAEVNNLISPIPSPLPAHFQSIMLSTSFGMSVLFCIAIGAVLIYYRRAFQPVVPPPIESLAA